MFPCLWGICYAHVLLCTAHEKLLCNWSVIMPFSLLLMCWIWEFYIYLSLPFLMSVSNKSCCLFPLWECWEEGVCKSRQNSYKNFCCFSAAVGIARGETRRCDARSPLFVINCGVVNWSNGTHVAACTFLWGGMLCMLTLPFSVFFSVLFVDVLRSQWQNVKFSGYIGDFMSWHEFFSKLFCTWWAGGVTV